MSHALNLQCSPSKMIPEWGFFGKGVIIITLVTSGNNVRNRLPLKAFYVELLESYEKRAFVSFEDGRSGLLMFILRSLGKRDDFFHASRP